MKEQVKKIQFWDVKEECSKYDINHNVRHTTKHVFIGQRWNVTSSDETNLMCQTQIKNRASFFKIGVKCAIAQFPLSPKPSQTRKLLENEFITKKSLEKLNLSINLPVIKVVSYLWRHWLTKEKQEFMFTLHIPVRPDSIMRETSCYTRLWYLEIDRAALYQTTTNYDVMDYKQCSLFRDTITTDCPVSVHVIPCCFCYTSLLNFLHIILLLVYFWCMKIFFLSGGYAKRNILHNEAIHSDGSSNLKKHG